jgi:hypothetical protein
MFLVFFLFHKHIMPWSEYVSTFFFINIVCHGILYNTALYINPITYIYVFHDLNFYSRLYDNETYNNQRSNIRSSTRALFREKVPLFKNYTLKNFVSL